MIIEDMIEANIRSYIAQNILFTRNGYPYSDNTSLLEEGIIDSMNVLELVSFVEQSYNVQVEDSEIIPENFDTITSLAGYIRCKKHQN